MIPPREQTTFKVSTVFTVWTWVARPAEQWYMVGSFYQPNQACMVVVSHKSIVASYQEHELFISQYLSSL